MVINENPEMFLREPFMKLLQKTLKVTLKNHQCCLEKKHHVMCLKTKNGNISKPKNVFRKTFLVMVENPFMVI